MKAELLANRRIALSDGAFADIRIWKVPTPVPGSKHSYKYSLAYVDDDSACCVMTTNAAKAITSILRTASSLSFSLTSEL